jgi:hypothetical protein
MESIRSILQSLREHLAIKKTVTTLTQKCLEAETFLASLQSANDRYLVEPIHPRPGDTMVLQRCQHDLEFHSAIETLSASFDGEAPRLRTCH